MANFLLIVVCLCLGMSLRRLGRLGNAAAPAFNSFIIDLALPALIFVQIPALLSSGIGDPRLAIAVLAPWCLVLASWSFIGYLARRWRWSQPLTGAMILLAGFGNTSFVGFPLVEALLGAPALRIAVIIDQLGSFLALATLGLVIAATYSGKHVSARQMLRRIAGFPPFLALVGAVIWTLGGKPGGPLIDPIAAKLSATLVPLAVFSVGLQLRFDRSIWLGRGRAVCVGLMVKLILAPAVTWVVCVLILRQHGLIVETTVLEMGMAPMITAAIVAADFGLDRAAASLMVGVGIPLSLFTTALWHWIFIWLSTR